MKRRVILLGPPGSGKGTVAAGSEKAYSLRQVSSGHLLRMKMARESLLGREAKLFLENAESVPNELVLKLMDAWLNASARPIEAVICFEAPESDIIQRLIGRRICSQCGRAYQMPEIAPRVPDVCDDCQSPLVQRNDAQEGVMRKRFKIYRDETDPLVGYYQRQGKLTLVSALLTVAQRIALAAAALN